MKFVYYFFALFATSMLVMSHTNEDVSQGGRAGATGAPGETTCASCHGGAAGGSVSLTTNIPAAGFIPGTTYDISFTVSETGMPLFGMDLEALTTTNASAGTFTITKSTETKLLSKSVTVGGVAASRQNVVHVLDGGLTNDTKTFTFKWTAPATAAGNVTFYYAGLSADNSGSEGPEDHTYTGKTVFSPQTVATPITAAITATKNASCFAITDGTATVTASGGSTYTYLWSDGQTTQTATNLGAGTYAVTVTSGTQTATATATISQPGALNSTIVMPTPISCANPTTAISVSTVGGTAPYTYSWSTAATTSSITVTTAGAYTVTITDSKGCTDTRTTMVTGSCVATPITATATATNVSCFNGNNGSATVTATGGTNYTYLWSNGQTAQTATNLASGTYTVTVTSGTQTVTASATVSQPRPLIGTIATPAPISCDNLTTTVSVSTSGGTAPYTYSWSNTATTSSITVTTAGVYTVTITDSKGCTATQTATVTGSCVATPITATATATNVSCFNGNNGSATVTATGGTNYTYLWSNGQTAQTATNLASGTYTVTVTSGTQTTTASATVSQPAVLVGTIATPAPISCNNLTTTVSVSASGGTAPYTYSWSNAATTSSVTVTTAGAYTVTITDSKGCTATQTATVTGSCVATILTATTTTTDVSCFNGNNGSATVTAVGGANYTYLWSNGQTTQTATNLASGTYTVTVTSGTQTVTSSATVSQPRPLIGTIATPAPISCNNLTTTVSVSASGGTAPYTYSWSNAATTSSITVTTEGTYSVTITDSKGCTAIRTTTVIGSCVATPITATTTTTDVSCFNGNNGSATVTAVGGTNYTYLWSNGQTTQTATNLAAGTYTVTVTSGTQTVTASATVSQPRPLIGTIATPAPISCNNLTTTVSVSASGGTAPYTYSWSNAATTSSITVTTEGAYSVTITDSKGCTAIRTTTVIGSCVATPITATATATNVSCFGGNNGSATVTATGGTNYTYLWSNGQTTQTATNLASGTYTVTVTSGTQTTTASATVSQPTALVGSITTPNPISCAAPSVSMSVSASGGTAPYTYSWSTRATSNSINTSSAGVYTVTITDSKGCSTVQSTTVTGSCVAVTCPTFAAAPLNVKIVNSTCTSNCTVSGGKISAPDGVPCPVGSSLQYSVNGGAWTTNLPIYTANPQIIKTRCSCNSDTTVVSPASVPTFTVPANCTNIPTGPTLTIVNNVLPSFVGTISATGCGAGTVVEYALSENGEYSTTPPTYKVTPITVYARCRNTTTGCVSPSVSKTTAPNRSEAEIRINCPNNISRITPTYIRTAIVTYSVPTATSTCTNGSVTMTRTKGLASGSAFPWGTSTICYTATDGCGNTKSCCFNIVVNGGLSNTNCSSIKMEGSDNSISISQLPLKVDVSVDIKVTNIATNQVAFQCVNNCAIKKGELKIKNIQAGSYIVQVVLYQTNADGEQVVLCQKRTNVNVNRQFANQTELQIEQLEDKIDISETEVEIVEVNAQHSLGKGNTLQNFILSPNPTNDQVSLDYDFPSVSDATIEVKNASGQIMERNILRGVTTGRLDIQTANWGNGLYFVTLRNDKVVQTTKLMVLR